jgi:hypothetical protein
MFTRVFICLVLIVLLSTSTFAFDGNRKGFVLGGGLGFALQGKYSFDAIDFEEDGSGLALNLVIGGAFDERNMLVYEGNVMGYTSDLFDRLITQGFNGASWYHYFGETGRSFYSTLGIGFYVFEMEDFDSNDPGFGLLLGGGYEFAKHWQVGAYYSYGKTSDAGFDFTHHHINLLFTGIAF